MKEFIETLDKYRDGTKKLDELGEAHAKTGEFKNFGSFLSDSDLRAKDPSYSVMQEKALAKFIKLLKSNDIEAAEKIKFTEDS